ncbi:Peptidyl-prolyl isomerase, partial [Globisporangium splendens]
MNSSDPFAFSTPELPPAMHALRAATDIPSIPSSTPVEPIKDNGSLGDVRVAAASKIQRLFQCRDARKLLHALLATVFEKFYDEDSGLYYYYNKRTGETTWEKPKVLKQHEDIALSSIYGEAGGNAGSDLTLEGDGTKLVDVEEQQPDDDQVQPETTDEDGEEEESDGDDNDEAEKVEEREGESQSGGDRKDALGFTAKERELVRQQFDHYDADRSGSISAPELLKLLTSLGEQLTLKNVQDMIKEVDKNSNGEVEFEEFLMILNKQKGRNQYTASLELAVLFGPKELDNLKRQFIKLDLDGSGSIDEHEIQVLIKKLGKKIEDYDLKSMLLEVDEDGSGAIGFNEFLKIIANMMKDNGGLKRSGFAALLDLGIAQGLLNELGDVMKLSQTKLYDWWNADMIAEQKRLDAKRERRRKQEEERRRQQEKDEAAYRERQAKLDAVEAARRAPIDGLVHEILFAGDGMNFPNVGQFARDDFGDDGDD